MPGRNVDVGTYRCCPLVEEQIRSLASSQTLLAIQKEPRKRLKFVPAIVPIPRPAVKVVISDVPLLQLPGLCSRKSSAGQVNSKGAVFKSKLYEAGIVPTFTISGNHSTPLQTNVWITGRLIGFQEKKAIRTAPLPAMAHELQPRQNSPFAIQPPSGPTPENFHSSTSPKRPQLHRRIRGVSCFNYWAFQGFGRIAVSENADFRNMRHPCKDWTKRFNFGMPSSELLLGAGPEIIISGPTRRPRSDNTHSVFC